MAYKSSQYNYKCWLGIVLGATVVVTTAPLVAQYGPTPQPMTCPYCHNHATTRLQVEPGMKTHVIALILCMFG